MWRLQGAVLAARAGIEGSNPAGGKDVCLLLSVVFCQVDVSATGRSLVQRSPVSVGEREAATMGRPSPSGGGGATGGGGGSVVYLRIICPI
jgi:hypothetical protein